MLNLRIYGQPPFPVAVVHGGPGACGELAPVARELASFCGVLEPIQTQTTLQGQIDELERVAAQKGALPITLIGHSWGAWLCYLTAAYHPELVRKLILVGSGPFEETYASMIEKTRLSRYTEAEKVEYQALLTQLNDPETRNEREVYARLGALASKAEAYDPLPVGSTGDDLVDSEGRRYYDLLNVGLQMRREGALLELAHRVKCSVVAIHGDYDSHPAEGVAAPLSAALPDFRMIVLQKCGHNPWIERQARDEFYRILKSELGADP